ncbi:MAG: serine/threonine-protein kinase [Sedimentisphaerales bacterium]
MKRDRNNPSEDRDFAPASNMSHQDPIGSRIGPYKLLSVLGEGGFGIVYLAEQKQPIRRQVALKVIKPGMDTKQVIARFEAERQALALLDHPNIAHVFEGGTTEESRPYFVMELVKGLPITIYCDHEKLSINERLELFRQVCEALQHAHQKGIIHRDIKPSNILVSIQEDQAVPKIIDFGIAKAISQPLTERTLFTEQGQLFGTPEYMSPEQAGMTVQDTDTRSDIYSLGVLLYELLTGSLPFDRKTFYSLAFDEILRVIREEDPPKPSTRLSSLGEDAQKAAKSRNTELRALTKRLHRELEWIPLKAIRKQRAQRYQSASEFAQDIQNYLDGNPLIAGPESVTYRLHKLVRRNRALVFGSAAVLLALLIGTVVSLVFAFGQSRARFEAERQARIAEAVVDFLNKDLLTSVDPAQAKGHEVTVREVLDAASGKIKDQFTDEPLVEASLRMTLADTYASLGEFERAEPLYLKALRIKKRVLGGEHPDTLISMNNLALLHYYQGRYGEAEALCLKTVKTMKRVLGEDHPNTLTLMNTLTSLYLIKGR